MRNIALNAVHSRAQARGEVVELEPLPSVVLEDTEIIPVNDKRLHGRSQRRNKAQVHPSHIAIRM
jgi:hypothetical protein